MGSARQETVVKPDGEKVPSEHLSPKQRYEPIPIANKVTSVSVEEPPVEAKTIDINVDPEQPEGTNDGAAKTVVCFIVRVLRA